MAAFITTDVDVVLFFGQWEYRFQPMEDGQTRLKTILRMLEGPRDL